MNHSLLARCKFKERTKFLDADHLTDKYLPFLKFGNDIKIHGLTRPIVEEAFKKTKAAREYIINNVLTPCIAEPRKDVGKFAPKIIQIQIDPQKIGDVVGQRGKTINAIIEQTGVKIDITDDGAVSICGTDAISGLPDMRNRISLTSTVSATG